MAYYTEGQLLISSSVSSNRIFCGGDKYTNAKALWGIVTDRRYREAPTYFKQVSVHGIPLPDSTTIDYLRTTFNWFGEPNVSTGTITPSGGEATKPEQDRYTIRSMSNGTGWYYGSGMAAYYGEQLPTIYEYNKSYVEIVGIPVFYYEDHEAIQAYIDRGDISGALNADELIEKLYANWILAYTNANNTIYSIAVDAPQFADAESDFYGKGEIAKVIIDINYNYQDGLYTPIAQYILPYGQTYTGQLSAIIEKANLTTASDLALKILDIVNIAKLQFSFHIEFTDSEKTVKSPKGFVEYDHAKIENYGFLEDITDDTITFRQGEVLDDEDSNISNAEIEDNEDDDFHENDETEIYEDATNVAGSTYKLTKSQIRGVFAALWGATFIENIKLINNNPIENVVSCKFYPFNINNASTEKNVVIGNVDIGTTAQQLTKSHHTITGTIPFAKYLSKFKGNLRFLNFAPYTQISVYFPYCGDVQIPIDNLRKQKSAINSVNIWYRYDVDLKTGNALFSCGIEYTKGDNVTQKKIAPFYMKEVVLGIDIPISAQNANQVMLSYATNAIDTVLNLTSGNIAGVVGNITNALQTQYHTTTKGTPTPFNQLYLTKDIIVKCTYPKVWEIGTVDTKQCKKYLQLKGGVLNEIKTLGSLKGFTVVKNANIKVQGATKQEIDEINKLLEEGVYI